MARGEGISRVPSPSQGSNIREVKAISPIPLPPSHLRVVDRVPGRVEHHEPPGRGEVDADGPRPGREEEDLESEGLVEQLDLQ